MDGNGGVAIDPQPIEEGPEVGLVAQPAHAAGQAHEDWDGDKASLKKALACQKACNGLTGESAARGGQCSKAMADRQKAEAAKKEKARMEAARRAAEARRAPEVPAGPQTKPGTVAKPTTERRPALRFIPQGNFMMGSLPGENGRNRDESQHEVELTQPYLMFETEVTRHNGRW